MNATSTITIAAPSARLLTPADGVSYETLRTPWNLAVAQHPAAVAQPADADDVAAIIDQASRRGLRVAVQGGAHNPGPLGDLGDAVLVRTSAMTEVSIDPVTRTARVEAGALWDHVVPAAAAHNLYPMHGSSPDVGVVGYSLGGGLSWIARAYGLQVDRVTAIEMVSSVGELVRADAEHEPELFWALRGGGGGFGIVTSIEFQLLPITTAYAGWLAWDWSHSERVLKRWAEWAASAPESVTTSARILRLPPLPEIPEPIRGRDLIVIDGAVIGGGEEGVIAPLRELSPEIDTFATIPAAMLSRLHGDPETPTPAVSGHALLKGLDDDAVSAMLAAVGPGSDSTLMVAELRQLGGALRRPVPGGGANRPLVDGFLLYGAAVAAGPEAVSTGRADADRLVDGLAPWSSGRRFANFTENVVSPGAFHDLQTRSRLAQARMVADPDGLFVTPHRAERGRA